MNAVDPSSGARIVHGQHDRFLVEDRQAHRCNRDLPQLGTGRAHALDEPGMDFGEFTLNFAEHVDRRALAGRVLDLLGVVDDHQRPAHHDTEGSRRGEMRSRKDRAAAGRLWKSFTRPSIPGSRPAEFS